MFGPVKSFIIYLISSKSFNPTCNGLFDIYHILIHSFRSSAGSPWCYRAYNLLSVASILSLIHFDSWGRLELLDWSTVDHTIYILKRCIKCIGNIPWSWCKPFILIIWRIQILLVANDFIIKTSILMIIWPKLLITDALNFFENIERLWFLNSNISLVRVTNKVHADFSFPWFSWPPEVDGMYILRRIY